MTKTLITGSVRGQNLKDTLEFMKKHVIDQNNCFLPETIPWLDEMNTFAKDFAAMLEDGIK